MPTPSEQKALAFIAIVALLGGAVRLVRANATPASTATEQAALLRQASAAETAAVRDKKKQGKRIRLPKPGTDSVPHVVAGVTSVSRFGYPAPGPRIDIDNRATKGKTPSINRSAGQLNLDVATVSQIEKLPRIGPSMAKRIIANRDSLGPFHNLESLTRVKGIGPATLKLLAEHVTFSGSSVAPR